MRKLFLVMVVWSLEQECEREDVNSRYSNRGAAEGNAGKIEGERGKTKEKGVGGKLVWEEKPVAINLIGGGRERKERKEGRVCVVLVCHRTGRGVCATGLIGWTGTGNKGLSVNHAPEEGETRQGGFKHIESSKHNSENRNNRKKRKKKKKKKK